MNRPTSLYLDLVRFLAATLVFLSHAAIFRFSGGLFWQLMPLGEEAVTVFFVLSGFVIAYAADQRETSARSYIVARLARVYSVAIPALALTFALDRIGAFFQPGLYLPGHGYNPDGIVQQVLNSIFFTNQVWDQHVQPGTDVPYWSLAFEAWYYVIFGFIAFAPRKWAIIGAGAALVLAGPRIASLWPMWLLGVTAYYICRKRPLRPITGLVLWLGSLVLLLITLAPLSSRHFLYEPIATQAQLRDRLHYYLVALLFTAHLIGFRGASVLFANSLERFAQVIRWLGGRTFALYLMHVPLIQCFVALSPARPSSLLTRMLVFLGVPVVVALAAQATEQQKHRWRPVFAFLCRRRSPAAAPTGP